MRFYCEAYEVITEEKKVYFNDIELEVKYSSVEELFIICEKLLDKKKVSFFYVDEKPLSPNHSYLSQLDVTYKTPDLMSHFLPPHEVSFTFCCSSIVFPR
ncbi:putative glutamine transport system permease protein [Streptococcus pneumoniae]|uniref:hypothetical protein n=1 Tax=Streptococcus pneumoniae TaxID=1313 RepID=UPI000766C15D|nr:hypothetical protein [Streptococcus pneumoniae]CWD68358.1 putative glutamine transport system permease protein [Streptococcus pneumoniae]VPB15119.1 putative glutamine transport system permease protein [Streptococcus pneumoniae]VPB69338.1 putative glutamine transport system permease protein [Streptococcus pneumoniae]VPB90966.1 putative glutamine transport system permease protein [Streptococcus pneumoniae]VPC07080.1 putative glutamine transport system permease protein [Streptococcus pneumonia